MIPFLRTPYNYDMHEASAETALVCPEETLTQQQFKDDADINILVERFKLGYVPPQNARMPLQGDFTGLTSFEDAMQQIRAAQETFNALPAKIRYRFHNDPAEFVAFCSDRDNLDEAVKMGLAARPELEQAPPPPEAPKAPSDLPKG